MKTTKCNLLCMILFWVMLCGCVTGCGSVSKTDSYDTSLEYASGADYGFSGNENADMEEYKLAEEPDAEEFGEDTADTAGGTTGGNTVKVNSSQKIIKRYDYRYETEHFDDAHTYLKDQIDAYNGYIASSEVTGAGYHREYRILYLTARIPAEQSDTFIHDLGQLGTIVRQSETAEDVTLQYSDTESRIASLETEQERLNALLEQADSLETIIALEERMTEVRYELENYQSKKKLYDNLIDYSTIEITLEEVSYTVEVDDSTFFSRIASGLESSFRDIGEGFVDFAEWIIIMSPYLILWIVIIIIIVKVVRAIVRRICNNKKKRKQDKNVTQIANEENSVNDDIKKKKTIREKEKI